MVYNPGDNYFDPEALKVRARSLKGLHRTLQGIFRAVAPGPETMRLGSWGIPIVSIVVPFFGLTNYILRILLR